MTPSQKFRRARLAQRPRISLRDMAELLNVHYRTAQTIENGRSMKMLDAAVDHFSVVWNIPKEWFFDGRDTAVPASNQVRERPLAYPAPEAHHIYDNEHLACYGLHPSPLGPAARLSQPSYIPVPASLRPGHASPQAAELIVFQCWTHDFEPRIAYGDILLARRRAQVGYDLLTLIQLPDDHIILGTYRQEPTPHLESRAMPGPEDLADGKVFGAVYAIWSPEFRSRKNLEWLFNQTLPA